MELLDAACRDELAELAAADPPGPVLVLVDPSGALAASAAAVLASAWADETERRDAHPHSGRWNVAELRAEILDPVRILPSRRHVIVVNHADDMDVRAAEKLLKTLEEPPSPAVFLLLVRDEQDLLPTVRSRVTRTLRCTAAPAADIAAYLAALLGADRAERLASRCGPLLDLPAQLAAHPELDDLLDAIFDPPAHRPFGAAARAAAAAARVASLGRTDDPSKLSPPQKAMLRRLVGELARRRREALAATAAGVDVHGVAELRRALADVELARRALAMNAPLAVVLTLLAAAG